MAAKSSWSESEDLRRKRLGRVIAGDDEAVSRILFQRGGRGGGIRATLRRAWTVERNWRLSNGPQIVVKAVGNRKSLSGTRACIRYIGRRRASDTKPVAVFDEFGRTVDPLSALNEWDLLEDHENLSRKARQDADKGEDWPERRRLHFVQCHHLIVSVPASLLDEAPNGAEMFEGAVLAGIDEAFTAQGFRVLWSRHDDTPEHPHVHLAVKAVSSFGDRLRFDHHGEMFDHLRQVFAEAFCRAGLNVQASRREDRGECRTDIMAGRQELRPRSTRFDGDLAKRAPHWVAAFGGEVVREAQGETQKARWWSRLFERKAKTITAPKPYEEAVQSLSRQYDDPVQALHRWLALARGGQGKAERALAVWHLRRRPELFGPMRADANELSAEQAVEVLRRLPLPPPLMLRDCAHDDNVVLWRKLRRKRRIQRDRGGVIGSLWRLASRIASGPHPDLWLAREILRRARSALDVAVQWEMPIRIEPSAETAARNPVASVPADKPAASGGGAKVQAPVIIPPRIPQSHPPDASPRPRRLRGKSSSF